MKLTARHLIAICVIYLMLDAVRYANAAAALTTTAFGAITAIPNRDTVKAFLLSRV